jgi:hypothetical protein
MTNTLPLSLSLRVCMFVWLTLNCLAVCQNVSLPVSLSVYMSGSLPVNLSHLVSSCLVLYYFVLSKRKPTEGAFEMPLSFVYAHKKEDETRRDKAGRIETRRGESRPDKER